MSIELTLEELTPAEREIILERRKQESIKRIRHELCCAAIHIASAWIKEKPSIGLTFSEFMDWIEAHPTINSPIRETDVVYNIVCSLIQQAKNMVSGISGFAEIGGPQ